MYARGGGGSEAAADHDGILHCGRRLSGRVLSTLPPGPSSTRPKSGVGLGGTIGLRAAARGVGGTLRYVHLPRACWGAAASMEHAGNFEGRRPRQGPGPHDAFVSRAAVLPHSLHPA
jgi:hypothetical protein